MILSKRIIAYLVSKSNVKGITYNFPKNLKDSELRDNWIKIVDWLK